jgi:DNA-binding transcriptional regulator LsrR (DeoR family)
MGPHELVQMAFVARRYYTDGQTHVQIAADTGISRFRVARLIAQAREIGLVTIKVTVPGEHSVDLSTRLQERYGLERAIAVVTSSELSTSLRSDLGRAAATLLTRIVTEDDVLGFASGRTLNAIVDHLGYLAKCDVVQLTGMAGEPSETSSELVRRVCEVSGGRAYPVYAPLVVSDPQAAAAFKRQPTVRAAYERMSRVTKAVIAVGSWEPPESQLSDALSLEERTELVAAGVRAEVAATLLKADGTVVRGLEGRTIAISLDELRGIPEVIVVAGGSHKTDALRAVLNTGVVTSLITDAKSAEKLLA